MFLTVFTQGTNAAGADASRIQNAQRAIVFRSAFLWVERAISGATQGAIGWQRKSRARKAPSKRAFRPLRRAIGHGGSGLTAGCVLVGGHWLAHGSWRNRVGWSEFGRAHNRRSKMLADLQMQVPEPLSQELETFLSPSRMRDPTVGILLAVFIRKHGLKRPPMQVEIQHIFGAEGRRGERRDKEFVHTLPSLLAHRGGLSRSGTRRHDQPHHR